MWPRPGVPSAPAPSSRPSYAAPKKSLTKPVILGSLLLAGVVIAFLGIRSSKPALADVQVKVMDSVVSKYKENPATSDISVQQVTLNESGNDHYVGTLDYRLGQSETFPGFETQQLTIDVTFSGDSLSWKTSYSTPQLANRLKPMILRKWAENPETAKIAIQKIDLVNAGGSKYEGIVSTLEGVAPQRFSLNVDSGDKISYDLEPLRYSVDELALQAKQFLIDRCAQNPSLAQAKIGKVTLSPTTGNKYEGTAEFTADGRTTNLSISVTYDGETVLVKVN